MSTVVSPPVSRVSVSWSLPRLPIRTLSSGYTFKTKERREVAPLRSCVEDKLSCGLCALVRQSPGRHDPREEVHRAGLCLLLVVADVGPEPDATGPGGQSPSIVPRKTVARLCCARWCTAWLLREGRWADEWSTGGALWDMGHLLLCSVTQSCAAIKGAFDERCDPWCTGWLAERPWS